MKQQANVRDLDDHDMHALWSNRRLLGQPSRSRAFHRCQGLIAFLVLRHGLYNPEIPGAHSCTAMFENRTTARHTVARLRMGWGSRRRKSNRRQRDKGRPRHIEDTSNRSKTCLASSFCPGVPPPPVVRGPYICAGCRVPISTLAEASPCSMYRCHIYGVGAGRQCRGIPAHDLDPALWRECRSTSKRHGGSGV
jgi:hypothetical protein